MGKGRDGRSDGPGWGARLVRGLLVFTAGALVGANAVYYVLSQRAPACTQACATTAQPVGPAVATPPGPDATQDGRGAAPPRPAASPGPGVPVPPAEPVASPDGAMVVPVAGVRPEQLVDTFTQSRGTTRRHDAIDIMAPAGTPVLAAVDGRVVKLFASKAGGITLYQFDTAERIVYYYAHLQGYAPDIVEGRVLKRGEMLGYVGSTGNADPSGPHLHFAIALLDADKRWSASTPVNPYPLLSGRPAAPVAAAPAAAKPAPAAPAPGRTSGAAPRLPDTPSR